MKNIIICQILKLKEQPEHLRPCYRDKWVSGKTDVTLHAPLPQPVKLLFMCHLSLCLPLCLQEVVIHQGKMELTPEAFGRLAADCFFLGMSIQGLGKEDWRLNLSVPGLGVLFNELWDMVPCK